MERLSIKKKRNIMNYGKLSFYRIFLHLRENAIVNSSFLFVLSFLEEIHKIIVLDIICSKFRSTYNISFPIYFLSPLFWLEVYLSRQIQEMEISKNCRKFFDVDKRNDQMSIISSLFFPDQVPSCNNLDNTLLFLFLPILLLLVATLILEMNLNTNFFKSLMKFFSIIFILDLKTFLCIFFSIPLKKLIIEGFLQWDTNFDWKIFVYVFIFAFFVLYSYTFTSLFLKCYYQENFLLPYTSNRMNIIKLDYFLSLLAALIINIRYYHRIALFFEIAFIFLLTCHFYFTFSRYLTLIHKSMLEKLKFMQNLFIITFLYVKLFDSIFITDENFTLIFKIGEFISICLLSCGLFLHFSKYKKSLPLSDIIRKIQIKNENCFEELILIYSEVTSYCEHLLTFGRAKNYEVLLKEERFFIVNRMKEDIRSHFLMNEADYEYIIGNRTISESEAYASFHTIAEIQQFLYSVSNKKELQEDFKIVLTCLNNLAQYLHKLTEKRQQEINFDQKLLELFNIIKILLLYSFDEKTYRVHFFLEKFKSSPIYTSSSYSCKCSLQYIEDKLQSLSQCSNENLLWSPMLKLLELDDEYISLIKLFTEIVNKFEDISNEEKVKLIDNNIEMVGENYRKIIKHWENSDFKLTDYPGIQRYKLANDIIFNEKEHDKLYEDFDIGQIDQAMTHNTYFILYYHINDLLIKKVPPTYIKLTGKKNLLVGQPFKSVFPSLIQNMEINKIKKNILMTSEDSFIIESIFIDVKKFIVGVNLSFQILPMINQFLLICNIEASNQRINNYALVTDEGFLVNVGSFFYHYFGILPEMRNINFFQLFKLQKNFRIDSTREEEIQLNIEQLAVNCRTSVKTSDDLSSSQEFPSLVNRKMLEKVHSHLISLVFKEIRIYTHKDRIFHLMLLKLKDTFSKYNLENDNVHKEKDEQSIQPGIGTLQILPFNTFSVTSSSFTSASVQISPINSVNTKKKGQKTNTKSIVGKIILFYNVILILFAIAAVIFIEISSINLMNVFTALKTLRSANYQFFNEHFHLSNVIILGNNSIYNDYEVKMKKAIPDLNMNFENFYQEQFQNLTNDFFQVTMDMKNNLSNYVDNEFTNNKINILLSTLSLDGRFYSDTFFSAINHPKNSFFIISNYFGHTARVNFFNIKLPYEEQFQSMTNDQKSLYAEILSYRNFKDTLKVINGNMNTYLADVFQEYQIRVLMAFFIFIFLHAFSFALYIYDSRIFYWKINQILTKILIINEKEVDLLKRKLKYVTKLIELEQKASDIVSHFSHDNKKIILSKEECACKISMGKNEEAENKTYETYMIHAYKFAIQLIIIINLTYILYSLISFPLLLSYIHQIDVSQRVNSNLFDIQRNLLNLYLGTRYSILINDTQYPITSGLLNIGPQTIYTNLNKLYDALQNENTLIEMRDYYSFITEQNACNFILAHDNYYTDLNKICLQETILQTNLFSVVSFFIRKIRNNYLAFIESPTNYEDMIKYYHSMDIQQVNLANLVFMQNFLTISKNEYANPIYTKDISNLVNFSFVIFMIMVMTEIANFLIIRIKGVKYLQQTIENFYIMQKFIANDASKI